MITQDFPPQTGGIQTYSAELARRFADRCTRFEVIAPADARAAGFDRELPYPVHRLPVASDRMAWATLTAGPSIAGRRFDAVFHAQWYTLPAGLLLRRWGRMRRVFVAAHGRELLLNTVRHLPGIGRGFAAARERMLRSVDLAVPVSRFTADILGAQGVSSERIQVAPNGVDAHRFAPGDGAAFRRAHGLGSGPLLGTVCRLVPRKGIDTVIDALGEIEAAIPGVRYVIGGGGPDRARLEARARQRGVADAVRFVGRVADDALADFMTAADVFVMPARSEPPDVEGFGLVFLEAGGCETAVLGARAGGVPDAIVAGETGALIEPDDPQALAAAAVELLGDPELRARYGAAARARILAACTWDHVAAKILDAMEVSLAEPGAR